VIPEVQPVVIGVLVIVEVGVFHLRVALAARSRRTAAMLLGAVNAVISVAALGQVLTNLDRPANVIGYAAGVSIGVYLGCVADDRLRARAAGRAGGSLTQMRRTRLYRRWLTRLTPPCPSTPSCSEYALSAVRTLGARQGLAAAARRVRACGGR
jgi:hypothetical protein